MRDQSSCGSCWAFATTEALNDRMCIKQKLSSTLLSPTDTAACCTGYACGFSNVRSLEEMVVGIWSNHDSCRHDILLMVNHLTA